MTHRSLIWLCVGILFSAIGLYLAFRNVPLSALVAYARQFDYRWSLPAATALALAYLVRTVRWYWLLLPAGKSRMTSAYHSIVISMMINCLLPGRAGELARPLVLKKTDSIPMSSSLAALGVERLLDLWALLTLLLPIFMAIGTDQSTVVHFNGLTLSRELLMDLSGMALATAAGLMAVVLVIGSDRLRGAFMAWMLRWPVCFRSAGMNTMGNRLELTLPKLVGLIENSAAGFRAICRLKGFLMAAAVSVVFWGMNALCFFCLSLGSQGIDLSLGNMASVMVIICLFIALPSVPGFWGLWEAAGVFALSLYGISNEMAAGFALFSHAFTLIPVIVAGWLSCLVLGLNWTHWAHPMAVGRTQEESRQAATLE